MLRERFSAPLDPRALELSASTEEDRVLLPYDLLGSVAHARMLGSAGLIPARSARRLERGLSALAREAARGRLELDPSLEDVHLNVEAALTRRIGPDGARLHTGRSRNDQVAVDIALYLREELTALALDVADVALALAAKGRSAEGRGVVDAWTHLQPAQAVFWGQLLGSHALRFARDAERLQAIARGITDSPLGAGAIAGSSLPLDRRLTSRLLGFRRPSPSSVDAVGDRDALVDGLFALALFGIHASQLAEELVIGANPQVGRVELADPFVTTSSLMPHKRNPDLAELVRAESAPSLGRLVASLALLKGLASGYQRDLQLAKPMLFQGVGRAHLVAAALAPMVATAHFRAPDPAAPSSTAFVEIADALVRRGVPFRHAHARVSAWARQLSDAHRALGSVSSRELARVFPELSGGRFRIPKRSEEPGLRRTVGGSAWPEVARLLREAAQRAGRVRQSATNDREGFRAVHRELGVPERLFGGGPGARLRPRGSPRSTARGRSPPGGPRARSGGVPSARGR